MRFANELPRVKATQIPGNPLDKTTLVKRETCGLYYAMLYLQSSENGKKTIDHGDHRAVPPSLEIVIEKPFSASPIALDLTKI